MSTVTTLPEGKLKVNIAMGHGLRSLLLAIGVVAVWIAYGSAVAPAWHQAVAPYLTASIGSYAGSWLFALLNTAAFIAINWLVASAHARMGGSVAQLTAFELVAFGSLLTLSWLPRDLLGGNEALKALIWVGPWLALAWIVLNTKTALETTRYLDEQGWFRLRPYKASQGRRTRRITLLSVLVLLVLGVYSFGHALRSSANVIDWQILAGLSETPLVLIPEFLFTLPLILLVIAVGVSYRLVHSTSFAEFLIATESEINKITWVSLKRLYQDTITVLVFVFLFTLYLLFVDKICFSVLTSSWVGILPDSSNKPAAVSNAAETDW